MKRLMTTLTLTLALAAPLAAGAKERAKHDFNSMIDNAAMEQKELAKDLAGVLETLPENPEAEKLAEFLSHEMEYSDPNAFVNNTDPEGIIKKDRQPNSVTKPVIVKIDFNI